MRSGGRSAREERVSAVVCVGWMSEIVRARERMLECHFIAVSSWWFFGEERR